MYVGWDKLALGERLPTDHWAMVGVSGEVLASPLSSVLPQCLPHRLPCLFQPRPRDDQRILLPIFLVEQLQRQHAAETGVAQRPEQLAQGRDAVAGINPVRVGN